MIEKTYQPSAVEPRIYQTWEEAGVFRAGSSAAPGAKPYSIVIPPPNVTGSLHMGHALNNTLQDILCRFERMRGRDVLWQPGTDHAGIATQMVVERQLAERQQPGRRDMGRERFLKKVWEWKAESGGTIIRQLKRLGASCDWSRERFTMDEGLSRAVMKVFVQLHREGLIYKDKRLVNWDPKLLTAISDLEVQQVECTGSFKWQRGDEKPFDAAALGKVLDRNPNGHLYYFNYPLEGATYSADDPASFITVATTRPETMLGDTAVAVHPENEKLKHLIGRHVVLPLVGRRIPIIGDEYANPEKGTGAVKITPAHDFNDFEVGKRHDLSQINILSVEGKLDLDPLPADAASLHGVDRFAARKAIVAMMEQGAWLAKIEPTTHMVPYGDRSGVVIEPFLTDQWYVDAKTLAQPAMAAVREGRTQFVPKNWDKTYFDWMENIQPWCISRQLWWGHQIPAWYAADGSVFVAETETEAQAEALAHMVTSGAITQADADAMAKDPDRLSALLIRDEDVLDTWFSSALWPFSTLGWPDKTPEVARYYPTTDLVTGFDIIFFWVARMMMMGLHFMKEVPFRTVYIHALVRDERGQKMSKSKGNVIDPLALIDEYGADALRFTLAAMAAQGRDVKLSTQRIEGYRNFATKLWNAARFAEMNGCTVQVGFNPASVRQTLNRWIAHELAAAAGRVTGAIEAYRFNDAANEAYRFVWNIFCDWYLELAKPVLSGVDGAEKDETRATTAWALEEIVKLLHPFMPFITEELWRVMAEQGPPRDRLLALASWPSRTDLAAPDAEAEIGWLVDLVTTIRSVRAEMNVAPSVLSPLLFCGTDEAARARATRWAEFVKRLARVSEIAYADAAPEGSIQLVIRGEVAALPLKGIIDVGAERERLVKERGKLDADIARADAKLNNADFMRRAPDEIVDAEREKRDEAIERRKRIDEGLDRLKAI